MFGRKKSKYKTNKITGRQQKRRDTNWVTGQRKGYADDMPKKRGVFGTYVHHAVLPGIFPRIKALGRHFGHFAYLLALVYQAVRLVPANHPILNPNNIGTFGFRDVFSVASDNLRMKRENLDQILVYFAVMFGFVMMIVQFIAIVGWIGISSMNVQAQAAPGDAPGSYSSVCSSGASEGVAAIFATPCPGTDVAYQMMRTIFGTNVFGVEAIEAQLDVELGTRGELASIQETLNTTSPLSIAFQKMLGFFSTAMLVIAVLIILYYVFSVIGEAAISGTPFGQRFDGFWAPLRIVLALGMLVPIGGGYNAAQYATLYIAKTGSSLATNAWVLFYEEFRGASDGMNVVAGGQSVYGVRGLFEAVILAETCGKAWFNANDGEPVIPFTSFRETDSSNPFSDTENGKDFADINPSRFRNISATTQNDFAIKLVWKTNGTWRLNKKEVCGEITIPMKTAESLGAEGGSGFGTAAQIAAIQNLNRVYLETVQTMIQDARQNLAPDLAASDFTVDSIRAETLRTRAEGYISSYEGSINAAIINANTQFNQASTEALNIDISEKGWAGAGLWYNQISKLNGIYHDAIHRNFPRMTNGLHVLETVDDRCEEARQQNRRCTQAAVAQSVERAVERTRGWFETVQANEAMTRIAQANSTWVEELLAWIFGLNSLFESRANIPTDPLAEIAMIGKDVTYHAYSMFTIALILLAGASISGIAAPLLLAGGGVGVFAILASISGPVLSTVAAVFFFAATVGLSVGFLLFYVLPLMPFIYFFFAVANWLAEIFEAIVAMPLFALAHIRIDGGGLPGQAASNGYFLLFGIMIRPILIVFGMIAGILIFSATAIAFNSLFETALTMLSVKGSKNGLDNIAYTVVYTVVMYNLAMTSFKFIDRIPADIMRWMGSSAGAFSDGHEDPMGNQQQLAVAAAGVVGSQTASTLQNASQGISQGAQNATRTWQEGKQNKDAENKTKFDNEMNNVKFAYNDTKSGDTDVPQRLSKMADSYGKKREQAEKTGKNVDGLSAEQWGKLEDEANKSSRSAAIESIKMGVLPTDDDGNVDLGRDDNGNPVEWGSAHDEAWAQSERGKDGHTPVTQPTKRTQTDADGNKKTIDIPGGKTPRGYDKQRQRAQTERNQD